MAALISVEGITKSFHGKKLLDRVSLVVDEAERVALVGPNGSGKSTLLRILAGREETEAGRRTVRRELRLGWFEQEPVLRPGSTARQALHEGASERGAILEEIARVHDEFASAPPERLDALLARQAALEARLERFGGHDVEHEIERCLREVGLPDPDVSCDRLSGGERRRVALARLFFSAPDLLLLDEPTNHLDAFVVDWLEDRLLESAIPFVMVTHDRYFLDRVVTRIVEIDRATLVSYDGSYADYLDQRAERLETEQKNEASRANLLRRETTWMRRGAPARTTKQKARIQRFHALVDGQLEARGDGLEFELPPGPRLGTKVLELAGASAVRGARRVIAPLDLSIGPGERIGIVGRNGAGKTTLLELCRGALAPASGRVEVGETVQFAWIDQARSTLDPEKTVIEEVAGRNDHVAIGDRSLRAAAFLEQFLFPGAMKHAPVGRLSGGERNRVLLAKLLCQGGNVLVLDEPTNDLDLASLRMLEEALLGFPGTVLVVSHDRWFLDRVATKVLLVDGEGGVRAHVGAVTELLEELARAGQAATPLSQRSTEKRAEPEEATPRQGKKKPLAPWEQREYDTLLASLAADEAELARLDARLAEPALYAGPKSELERVNARRGELCAKIERAYARWEELETR